MGIEVYRVVVRGQFADLDDEQRAALAAEAADHDIFRAAYTEWGTFTYEPNLVSFSFRYEVRRPDDDPDAPDPAEVGLAKARASLGEWGLGSKHLRVTGTTAMSEMWST